MIKCGGLQTPSQEVENIFAFSQAHNHVKTFPISASSGLTLSTGTTPCGESGNAVSFTLSLSTWELNVKLKFSFKLSRYFNI